MSLPVSGAVVQYLLDSRLTSWCILGIVLGASKEAVTIEVESGALLDCLPECEHYDYTLEVAVGTLAKHAKLSGFAFLLVPLLQAVIQFSMYVYACFVSVRTSIWVTTRC